ncbi:hypothetical protein MPSEU_001085100 [Mayamaea pseudoterrestris]|nr:hypothetical protein MPSEU_001085100 [Mayamaea pseudoterrestris]
MMQTSAHSESDDRSISSGTSGDKASGRGDISTSNASSKSEQEMLEEKEAMFKNESAQVTKLKRFVLLIMILAGIAISAVIFVVSSKGNVVAFESDYNGSAEKLLATFQEIAEQRLGAISSLSVALTAHALDRDSNWPHITLSYFQERALMTRYLSGTLLVTVNPLVAEDERDAWENYSFASEAADWHKDGHAYQMQLGYENYGIAFNTSDIVQRTTLDPSLNISTGIANHIFNVNDSGEALFDRSKGPYLPTWQTSPVFLRTLVNENLLQDPDGAKYANSTISTSTVVVGGFEYPRDETEFKIYSILISIAKKRKFTYKGSPLTRVYIPVFDSFDDATKKPVAVMTALIRWVSFFDNVLPKQVRGIDMVLESTCSDIDGDIYTFSITGHEPEPIGAGDRHDVKFAQYARMATMADVESVDDGSLHGIKLNQEECVFQMTSYPNQVMLDDYQTNLPALITFAVAMVFAFTFAMFLVYDKLVERRQNLVLQRAEQTTAIVQSLFPKSVADKLIQETRDMDPLASKNQRLNKFLSGDEQAAKTIADLFPECTVLFADISGFTAWSSTRDPSQVFQLLEAIYNSFDDIAKSRKVFKVETIGDCYVAVTGLPDPQANHAVIMARFASECMIKIKEVTQRLETTLGPDTAELCMRVGMHSGPVTAGVLRGDKSRFQLFGDTVNTASRMESTGTRERIQVSQETANKLTLAGKGHWLSPREDTVNAKGKGVLQTYWLRTQSKQKAGSVASSGGTHSSDNDIVLDSDIPANAEANEVLKRDRKVDWMTELLGEYLKQIHGHRIATPMTKPADFQMPEDLIGINEVVEAILLPHYDAKKEAIEGDWHEIEIEPVVMGQLREYVSIIASMYRENPFHNFEHACHVTMSVAKHLKRIATPELEFNEDDKKACKSKGAAMALIHDYTHGINSDPITHFAIVFSGLIHDVDHRGISNMQLEKEEPALAAHFKHQSLAEQNSLEIAWTLLMSEQFAALRQSLFATKEEFLRFRQVMVNAVMATDIFDKELNQLRKNRWEKAFSSEVVPNVDKNTLRATIVLEHIIQASDVSHTMQHWHIYRKWNRLLFKELTMAYRAGKMAADPASFWMKGELGFFDGYIIPLAKKLMECKVFGVNSDECLNYAVRNRAEWEVRGEEIVAEMVKEFADWEPSSSSDNDKLFL